MTLGALTFLNPWILAGLAVLPALWFLLRVMPPAPRLIVFPPARFLADIEGKRTTSSRTPWWILLMRLTIAALIVIAMADPVLNLKAEAAGAGTIRIVIDNGWASSQTWDLQISEARSIVSRAERARQPVIILTTAPEPEKSIELERGPVTAGEADSLLKGLHPYPWPSDYDSAADAINNRYDGSVESIWLSNGLQDQNPTGLIRSLKNKGTLTIIVPDPQKLPLLLRPVGSPDELKSRIERPPSATKTGGRTLEILTSQGQALDIADEGATNNISAALRSKASRIQISGCRGAGCIILLDNSAVRRKVGIFAPQGGEKAAALADASFYLQRALEPIADTSTGAIADMIDKSGVDVLILPDTGGLPPDDLEKIEGWVKHGGLLLRFAGPNMTQEDSFLTPTPLLKGGRALDSAMGWEKPMNLASFPEHSPYYGLTIPPGITVSRQILAQPVDGIERMTWAALEDGTPLITAKNLEDGLLVMVHTTATPAWSDIVLSGLFVKVLERTLGMAGKKSDHTTRSGMPLQPILVLDGFGELVQPKGHVLPIQASEAETIPVSASHPPGIYGNERFRMALNLGDLLPSLTEFSAPPGVPMRTYTKSAEKNLMPFFIVSALILFLIDWIVMLLLQSSFSARRFNRRPAATIGILALIFFFLPSGARAETTEEMLNYAGNLHLAYVRSGLSSVDYTAHAGLEALKKVLTERTSVEPAGIVALDLEHDDLSFFPLIYWPVSNGSALPDSATRKIQDYLDHGGTILFDTRNNGTESLRIITQGLNIPPLIPLPKDHVITKSFYLLRTPPALWIEETSANGRDGVSSVIIADENWAAAWAGVNGGGQDQEMALRFGINLMMYALTGNYKADQVHLPYIMERLDQ